MIHLGNQTVWPLSFMSGVEALYPPAVLGKGSPALHQPFTLSFQSMQCHGQLFQGSLRNPKNVKPPPSSSSGDISGMTSIDEKSEIPNLMPLLISDPEI